MTDNTELSKLQSKIDQNPKDENAWFQLGFLLLREGKPSEAKTMLEKSVELNPENFKAWAGLGVIAANRKDLKSSEEFYKKAVKIESKFNEGWFALARVYWAQAKYKDAEKALKNCAFDTSEEKLMVYRELALVYMMWKKPANAEKPLKQAIELAPSNPEFKIMMHRVLMEQKNNRGKENQAILILREIPIGTMSLEELVKALDQAMQIGDFVAAVDFGRRILEIDPNNIDGLFIQHRDLREKYNFYYTRMRSDARVYRDGWATQKLGEEIKSMDGRIRNVITSSPLAKMRWNTLNNQYPLAMAPLY